MFWVHNEIEDKKAKRPSLLELLIKYQQEEPSFLDEDLQDEIEIFTFAGQDTTGVTLAFALWLLARHHDVQEKLRQEIDDHFPNDKPIGGLSMQKLGELAYLDMVLTQGFIQRLPFWEGS